MDKLFKDIYFDPNSPGSLGGLFNLYRTAKKFDPSVTVEKVKDWLRKQRVYTLHRPARRRWQRNRIYVSYIDEQWEIDLIELRVFSTQNDGYNYILMIIDVFSKQLFAFPTKTKTALEILNIFKVLFQYRKPSKLRSDRGGEFDNIVFREFCKNNNVIYFTTENKDIKCAVVERVNRTIKEKMFRYFTLKGTRRYIDILPKLINSYNNSYHRSIKMAPTDVTPDNENVVYYNLYGYDDKELSEIKFNVGDDVRLKYDLKAPFDKSYYPLWDEKFIR